MCEHIHHEETENKYILLGKLSAAIVLFCIGLLISHNETAKFWIFIFAYIIAGGDIIVKAIKNICRREFFDENFLMTIATVGAFGIKEYPEAVMVMILYQIGEYFQDCAVEKSRDSITDLMDLRQDFANKYVNGEIEQVSPQSLHAGDIIICKPGEKIPADGTVIDGSASIDTSALTGESVPRKISAGDNAISGCINTDGLIKIRVEKEFEDSTVSKILELVENASSKKTKTENFITKFAHWYTPVVVALAVILGLLVPVVTGGDFQEWISRALTFLVISCPCALVISVPLGFFAGIGGASKCGILVKGSSYIELLSRAQTVVFDKTGTLTKGIFKVVKVLPVENTTQEELLRLTAYAEIFSNHPIATSIKAAYNKPLETDIVSHITEIAGRGLKAEVNNDIIFVGNSKLMNSFNVPFPELADVGTVLYTAKNGCYLGTILISDELKNDAVDAISGLKNITKNIVMLTGDSKESANYTSGELQINEVYSRLLPEDKVAKIEEFITKKDKGMSIIFVGDGINDAPVLMRADVGIAMGALGSDAAIEAADVVIMDDKPSKVKEIIKISKKTMSIVKQNIIFALGVKIVFLILGAVGFMSMWGAVFADVGVTLIAVLNSMRAFHIKKTV